MSQRFIFLFTIIVLNLFVIHKTYANIIFEDNFTGANGTPLTKHNNLWLEYPIGLNEAIISNNKLQSNGSNSKYYIPSLINLSDYCVQVDFIYPLPQTFPPDFFDISTRNTTQSTINAAGLNATGLLFLAVNFNPLFEVTPPLSVGTHILRLCSVGNKHSLYMDNNLITTITDSTYSFGAPGFDLGNNTAIDNFIVSTVNDDLNVNSLKQTSNPWQSQEYDTAHLWNPSNITINRWGCALTSAVMILQYYGYYTLPGPGIIPLDPGSLNDWLKSQPDGYLGTGWVNWLALSRLSKLATSTNFISNFDALEYHRLNGADKTQLTNDLNNKNPDILEEPGHFIVAKGINGNTFDINDPYYDLTTLDNSRYNNSFVSLGRYIPASTDLSYIMLTANSNVVFVVKDSQGNIVGDSFIQSPILNPLDTTDTNSPIKMYYLPKPDSGNYTIAVSSTEKPFEATSYLYDKNGMPKIQSLNGFGGSTYSVSFNKDDFIKSQLKRVITFESTIQDIKDAQNLKLINNGLATSLMEMVKNAQKLSDDHKKTSIVLLTNGINFLEKNQDSIKTLSTVGYTILFEDFTTLREALQ